jgi:catalase
VITPEHMIDELNGVFGRHEGCRTLHAKGQVFTATFTATPEAARLTRAGHLQGAPVRATVRVSNGDGNPHRPDGTQDVRGLAVKFYLEDGTRTDLVAQTIARSNTRTADEFIEVVKAAERRPASLLRLPWFLVRHPKAVTALPAVVAGTKPPPSYATVRYYPLHAYRWVDADGGARHVRYTFVPEASDAPAGPRGPDYLQEEILERLARGPVRFRLQVQIAGPGDDVDDSTANWPADREVVTAGTLEITGLDPERDKDGDVLVFDPCRVVDGIELTDDPMLRFRSRAYSASVERRSGVARPADYLPKLGL